MAERDLDKLADSPEIRALLDSVEPMCEVGRRRESPSQEPCPAKAVYLLGFRCEAHSAPDQVQRALFCTGHRNLMRNLIDAIGPRIGHPYRLVFEELL